MFRRYWQHDGIPPVWAARGRSRCYNSPVTIGQHLVAAATHPAVLGAALALLALHLSHCRSALGALRLAASILAAWLAAHALKFLVGDPRPAGAVVDAWGSGWPSGHAAVGAATALGLWFALAPLAGSTARRACLGVILAVAALALAVSRLYLGVHDLGDLAGGLAVGLLVAYLFRPRR